MGILVIGRSMHADIRSLTITNNSNLHHDTIFYMIFAIPIFIFTAECTRGQQATSLPVVSTATASLLMRTAAIQTVSPDLAAGGLKFRIWAFGPLLE